jgi:hypothetical protein
MLGSLSRSPHWLRTPCALRLREPNRDVVTSDVLCRTTALGQELLSHLRWTQHASPCDETRRALRRARARPAAACLRPPHAVTQDAFVRIDAQPCSWTELVREICSLTRPSSAPFQVARACPPCPGRAAALSYPAPSWLASRLTSTAPGRCFSPTSATDVRYEHPLFARLPSPRLAPR